MKLIYKLTNRTKAKKKLITSLLLLLSSLSILAIDQIDIALYESSQSNKLEVYIRPNYDIAFNALTSLDFSIRYSESGSILTCYPVLPMITYPVAIPNNGYYYQPFNLNGQYYMNGWTAGTEYLVAYLEYDAAVECELFELISDDFTVSSNIDFYAAVQGFDKTGIIHTPIVDLGTIGGVVTGGSTINLGNPTGTLALAGNQGTVNTWQKRQNSGTWTDISSTSGLTVYSETPASAGVWDYRCEVQQASCAADYSESTQVIVVGSTPSSWTGAIDDDWFKDGNWTTGVPWALNARIPDVSSNPYPVIVGDAVCYGLELVAVASVTIDPQSTLTAAGNTVNNGTFTIQSSALGTGSFIDNGSITGSGTSIVERYLTEEKWHYVSPPISNGLSALFMDIYLMSFDEVSGAWTYIVPVDVSLNVMQGYAAWPSTDLTGTTTVSYTGNLNTGPQSIGLTRTSTATTGSIGYNFVGNPYPSAVNWNTDAGWTKTDIDNAIYLYNSEQKQYGAYVYGDAVGTNMVTNIIPPGQGFFVRVSDGNSTGTLGVNNDAREHNDKAFFKSGNVITEDKLLKLKVSNSENVYTDESIVRFNEDAQPTFDATKDAYKLNGDVAAPQMYSLTSDGQKMSINTLGELLEPATITVGLEVGLPGIYTFQIEELINFEESTEILLEDLKENLLIDLINQTEYSFSADPLDDAERFLLHFNPNAVSNFNSSEFSDLQVYAYKNEVVLRSLSKDFLTGTLSIHNILGRTIYETQIVNSLEMKKSINEKGVFIVTFINSFDKIHYKRKVIIQ